MAEDAARELEQLSLEDALWLVTLYARKGDPKFERAAVRWLGRLAIEGQAIDLHVLLVAVAAMSQLRGPRADESSQMLSNLSRGASPSRR